MKRRLFLVAALLSIVGVWTGTRMFEAERLRARLKTSLEQALHRQVDLGGRIDYKWLTGPGLEVTDVVIHEDPKLGREPIVYVSSLEATPRWLALLRGRFEFSTLNLVNPSVNVSRASTGEVNIQPLLRDLFGTRDSGRYLPEIRVQGGRVNFRQGLRKAGFYLTGTDLELRPIETNGFLISVSAEGGRTDRPPAGFASFSGQGRLRFRPNLEPELDLTIDLDRSPVGDVVTLIDGRRTDLAGRISARARINGPLSKLTIDGDIDLEGFQRWSLPGYNPGAMTVFYRGEADLAGEIVTISTVRDSKSTLPLDIRFRAQRFFSQPLWAVVAGGEQFPLALVADVFRAAGFRLPDNLLVPGLVSGALGYSSRQGVARGGLLIGGDQFEGEFRLVSGDRRPQRLRIDASTVEIGDVRARGVRLRAAGSGTRWDLLVDFRQFDNGRDRRGARASGQIDIGADGISGQITEFRAGDYTGTGQIHADNRFVLTAGGQVLSGTCWPPAVNRKRRLR